MTEAEPPPGAPAEIALARWWWLFVLRGVVSVLVGLAAFVWPAISAVALVLLLAAWMLVEGGSSLVAALRDAEKGREALLLGVEGLIGIAAGVVAFAWPAPTLVVLALLAGAWAIATGLLQIAAAIRLRRQISGELLMVAAGAASIVVGVVLVFFPVSGIVALTLLLAAYAVVFGAFLIGLGIRLWRLHPAGAPTR
ncbi:MAG: DUF308 domain-containing protein [Chloroflexota bacterium]